MIGISFAQLVLLGLVVIVVVTLVGVVSAAEHKRWGIVFAVPAMLVGTIALLSFLAGNGPHHRAPAEELAADLPAIPGMPNVPGAPGVPGMRLANAEVVSDAELEAIAGTAPKIDLSEADEDALSTKDPARPDWIDSPSESDQLVLTTDPYTTTEACKDAARRQLTAALGKQADLAVQHLGDNPAAAIAELEERFVEDRYLEKREVSVGEVYLMHTLVELDKESVAWLAEKSKRWNRIARRQAGIRDVVIGGGGVLVGVALLHGFLRGGKRRPKR